MSGRSRNDYFCASGRNLAESQRNCPIIESSAAAHKWKGGRTASQLSSWNGCVQYEKTLSAKFSNFFLFFIFYFLDPQARRSKTPTPFEMQQAAGYQQSNSGMTALAPNVRPRSKTPGPVPNRPTKPNGFLPQHQGFLANSAQFGRDSAPFARDSAPFGNRNDVPIYENVQGMKVRSDYAPLQKAGEGLSPSTQKQRSRPKTPSGNFKSKNLDKKNSQSRPKTPSGNLKSH